MNEEFTIVQLKNRIKELEQQVSLYEKIIDFVPISIFAKDVQNEYRYLVWNKQLEKVFGTKKKDIIGTHDYDLFENKTDADYFRNYDMEVMKGKQIVDIPQEDLRTVEGIKIVHTRKIPIYDDNGNPQILLGCLEDITERIETEQALIASEFKYKQLFENLTVPFALHEIICDEKGKPIDYRYLEANPEFIFRTGLSPENLINKRGLEIFPTTEWSWIEHYGQVALTGETLKFENYSYELDKYYEAVAFSPQPKQFAVLFNDITMHKRVEKEISDAKMFYSDLVETAQDLIWKCNDKGQFTFLNNACEKIYGYKINEMLGRPFTDFMEEETARRDKVIFKKLLFETGIISGYETTHIKKDGNPVYLSFNAKKYEDKVGNFFGAQGTAHDLTNRKKIEKALKVSEEQFRKLLEMLPVAVAIHCEGMLKYVNNNVLQILKGESKDDFFEKPAIELVHPESRNIALQRIHEAIVKQQIAPLYEEKFITLEGEPVDVEVTSLPTLFDLKPAMLVVFQDISKRKQHEQTLIEHEELLKHQNEEYETLNEELTELNNQLSKAKEKAEESDRLKSAFLANMSHEIRTPMNGIIGFADLINEPDIDNEKRKSYSEIIKNSCFQLLNIVNDIIDISKIETGQIEIK
jgi:two-component system CheB/CheR fusion protein